MSARATFGGSRRPTIWWPSAPAAVTIVAGAGAAIALVPLLYLAQKATAAGWTRVVDELTRRGTTGLVVRSVLLATTVTAASVAIAVPLAWLVGRADLPGRRLLQIALALPMAMPSYLSAFAWVSWRPTLAGFPGAVLVLTLVSYPYVYLPVLAALRRLDPAHEDVARSLGAGTLTVAWRVVIAPLRPAIVAGALMVALYVLGDFGAVAAMRYEVFTWVIYGAYRSGFDPARAAILSLMLIIVSLILVGGEGRARGRVAAARLGSGVARHATSVPIGRAKIPAAAAAWMVVAAGIGFPIIRVVQWVVDAPAASTSEPLGRALVTTLLLGAAAAAAAALLAVPIALLAARFPSRMTSAIDRSSYLGHALPGIVVAISMVYVGVRLLRPIYQQYPIVVIAYVALFLPVAIGSTRAAIELTPVRSEETARSLGLRPLGVIRRVTLPLAAPGIGAGAALVMLAAMKELPATLLLRPTGGETLATQVWAATSVSDYASAGHPALALVLVACLPTAVLAGVRARRATTGGR